MAPVSLGDWPGAIRNAASVGLSVAYSQIEPAPRFQNHAIKPASNSFVIWASGSRKVRSDFLIPFRFSQYALSIVALRIGCGPAGPPYERQVHYGTDMHEMRKPRRGRSAFLFGVRSGNARFRRSGRVAGISSGCADWPRGSVCVANIWGTGGQVVCMLVWRGGRRLRLHVRRRWICVSCRPDSRRLIPGGGRCRHGAVPNLARPHVWHAAANARDR